MQGNGQKDSEFIFTEKRSQIILTEVYFYSNSWWQQKPFILNKQARSF